MGMPELQTAELFSENNGIKGSTDHKKYTTR